MPSDSTPAATPKPISRRHAQVVGDLIRANPKMDPAKLARVALGILKALGYDVGPIVKLLIDLGLPDPTAKT